MKRRVPDRAMVPMFSTTSSRDMPMPLSATVRVRASGSKRIEIRSSPSPSVRESSERAAKRSRSAASEALEMSSRRKISLLL